MKVQLPGKAGVFDTSELAEASGIKETVILSRLARGWKVERAITEPTIPYGEAGKTQKKFSKNEAEEELNATGLDKWPKNLAKLVRDYGYKGPAPGRLLRELYKNSFDKWYFTVWLVEKKLENGKK